MPTVPPAEVIAAIEGPVTQLSFRVEIFLSDGVTRFRSGGYDDRLKEGSVTIDYSRDERRACSLVLDNSDFGLVNEATSTGIWYDKVFKPYYTVNYYDDDNILQSYDFQLGEFIPDLISEPSFPNEMQITLRDYAKRCLLSKFSVTTTYSSGQAPEAMIKTLALLAGITKFTLPVSGVTTGKDFTWEQGVDRWTAMKDIASAYNYDIFFDNAGYLNMTPYNDPVTSPLIAQLSAGVVGNLVDFTQSTNDSRMYNHIVVVGDTSDSTVIPVYAEAINTEPSSPTNVSRLGDRTYTYASTFITTQPQAQAVADSFLKVHALEEFNLDFGTICYPWLDVGFIIGFSNPNTGMFTRLLLSSLTIPLTPEAMSGNGKRVLVVS